MLYFFTYTIKLDLEGFRYTPMDFTFLWNLDKLDRFCYALQWSTRGLKTLVNTVLYVDECQVGLFGIIFT